MPTPLNYRRRARQLATLAELAPDDSFRKTYLEMASRFESIAERLERGEPVEEIPKAPKKRRRPEN
jgi:hypothetical protein